MKKIYITLGAILVLLTALMIVYRIENPPQSTPTRDYTRVKAELLLHNYRQDANEEDDTGMPDHSKIYGVMIERSLFGTESAAAADFIFFDCFGACTRLCSDNSEYRVVNDNGELSAISERALDAAKVIFDDTFSRAKKSNYDIPREKEVKIYVRAGDGVYYKIYAEPDVPEELLSAYTEAARAFSRISEFQTEK